MYYFTLIIYIVALTLFRLLVPTIAVCRRKFGGGLPVYGWIGWDLPLPQEDVGA